MDRIRRHLPDIYGASGEYRWVGTLADELLAAFALELDDLEVSFQDVLRTHWVDAATELESLARLGALVDVAPRAGEELPAYRRRLKRTIQAYLSGVGTRSVVRDIVVATLGVDNDSDVEIEENPARATFSARVDLAHYSEWEITVSGFEPLDERGHPGLIRPRIIIDGVDDRTVSPTVTNVATGEQVRFDGAIPAGSRLVVRPDGSATLDGVAADDRVVVRRGVQYDRAYYDRDAFTETGNGTPSLQRGASLFRLTLNEARLDAAEFDAASFAYPSVWRGQRFADAARTLPRQGDTPGDVAVFDESLFAREITPRAGHFDRSHFDECVAARPRARIRVEWVEHEPSTFVVRMPWEIISWDPADGPDPRHLVAEEIQRVRASGIRARVEYTGRALAERQVAGDRLGFRSALAARLERQTHRDELSMRSHVEHREAHTHTDGLPTPGGVFDSGYYGWSVFTVGRTQFREEHRAADRLEFVGTADSTRFGSSRFA